MHNLISNNKYSKAAKSDTDGESGRYQDYVVLEN